MSNLLGKDDEVLNQVLGLFLVSGFKFSDYFMGYIGYVYVESKSFEVRSDVRGGVRLEERKKGLSRSVIMAWPTIFWLIVAWDSLTHADKAREKWRSFRFGSIVYVLLRRKNNFGNFLELSEYGEKGRRCFVTIPEGEDGRGWSDCREQLSKLKHFHEKQKLGGLASERQPGNASAAVGINKGKEIISSDQSSLQGAKKSYAAVVQGFDQSLSLNFQTLASKSKVGAAGLKEINGSVSLADGLSAEKGEKEKDVILTSEEQVAVGAVRDMLSDFKKDLLKALENLLEGWIPLTDVANRAKKGADSGRPKMRKEKPSPPVKFTYFRKKPARPKLRWQKVSRPVTIGSDSVHTLKPAGATRTLEKGEGSGTGPGPIFPVKQTTPAIDTSGNPEGSGSRLESVAASGPPILPVGIQSREVQRESRQTTPAKDIGIVGEMPSPLADAERTSVGLELEEVRQNQSERVPGFAGGGPNIPEPNILLATSGSLGNAASVAASGSPVESAGAQFCEAQEIESQTLPERDLVFVGERPSTPVSAQILPASVSGFAGERPSPPVSTIPNQTGTPLIFQGCQRLLASGSVCSTLSGCSPGLSQVEDLQISPGELPLAVNSKSMDDDLCSVLMRSQVGEDEAQLAVQPLNVLYPCAEKELEFPDWVIKCAERIHSRVGITYIGHKWQFMALLIFIERERLKELEAQSPSVSKRNREIKNLESSINYDNRGDGQSSRGKRKGRGSKVVL
jgi:hypothetical protein